MLQLSLTLKITKCTGCRNLIQSLLTTALFRTTFAQTIIFCLLVNLQYSLLHWCTSSFSFSNSTGYWSTEGCHKDKQMSSDRATVCHCNHLTHFAVLMRVTNDKEVQLTLPRFRMEISNLRGFSIVWSYQHIRDLSEISRGDGGGNFKFGFGNEVTHSCKGVKICQPSPWACPKYPAPHL